MPAAFIFQEEGQTENMPTNSRSSYLRLFLLIGLDYSAEKNNLFSLILILKNAWGAEKPG
jgi:hypothetical protein